MTLRELYSGWMQVGQKIGHVVSGTVLTVFYFTVFALFAIPYKVVRYITKSGSKRVSAYVPGVEGTSFETEF